MAASRRPSVFSCALVAVVVVGIVGLASSAASAAPAGDPAAVAKVTNLNKKALEAYSQQDYDGARDALKQALELCDSAGLDQHPITARTHIHFGAVAIVGYKQRELGLKHFRKALEIEPDIKLTKSIATPELQDAFEEAVLAGDSNKGGGAGNANAGGDDNGSGNANAADNGGASDDSGKSAAGSDDGDDDNPRPRPKPKKPKKSDDDDEKGGGDEGAGQKGTIFLGLTIGTSFGIASGSGHLNPTAHKLSGPGFASGQLGQIEPQIGFFVTPTTMLSLVGRLQYVSGASSEASGCGSNGTDACNPTTLAAAVLARATWLLTDGPLRVMFGAQVGGGYVVHAVTFPATSSLPSEVDSVLGGAFLFGPTVGLMYELGDSFNLIAALDTEIGAPKFTFNFDIDLGLGLRF